MKKLLLQPALLAVLLLTACLFLLPTAALTPTRVYDPAGADLLTADEESYLNTRLDELSAEHGVEFYLATYVAYNRFDDFLGDDYCVEVQPLRGKTAILLVITYDRSDRTYYYDMYTYGRADSRISGTEVDYILDDSEVYPNLKGGRLCAGAEAFFTRSAEAYQGRLGASFAVIIPICAAIAALIAWGIVAGVKATYRKKPRSAEYPLDRYATLKLTREKDSFAGQSVSRSYVPRSNGSRGGGSSHGGGGGHRGGR